MNKRIVFIHGMFMNPASWANWREFFGERGYACDAPAWPHHEGVPSQLRTNPHPQLGKLSLGEVIESLADHVRELDEPPVLVGHSMGGLIVQRLLGEGLGAAGVCIDSAPPKGIVSFKPSFLRSNLPVVNPLKGDTPCLLTLDQFHYMFCNVMTDADTRAAYEQFVVPESRNVARSSAGADGEVDFAKPHPPLLFVAGERDNIIPASLNRKNYAAYRDGDSRRDFVEFQGRSHFICGQEGWEEVSTHVADWLEKL